MLKEKIIRDLNQKAVIMKQVNNDFRAIILIDENLLEQQQPSFLNWFEKHSINYINLLDKKSKIFVKFILICFNCLKIIIKKNICFLLNKKKKYWEWFFNYLNEEIILKNIL